jgi:hypothetical protein
MAMKYGIWLERDLDLDELATNVDRDALLDAQQTTLQIHNQEIDGVIGLFADPVTKSQTSVKLGTTGRHQPLDEFGRPKPTKPAGNYFVGFPLVKAGSAEGFNFWAENQMTVRDFADSYNQMLTNDVTWVRDQLLAALFYNGAGYTFSDVRNGESVTVYGLANGDANVYDKVSGAAIDDHYLVQANAIGAGADNPYPTIQTELTEHASNGTRVVAFIAPAQQAATELLAGFAPVLRQRVEPTLAAGSADTFPLFAPSIGIDLPPSMVHIGTHGNIDIVVWQNMPSGYGIALAIDAQEKPLGVRQYPQAALRGLVNQGEPMSQFPYRQNNYVRALGFGGKNRIAAVAFRVGNGTYAAPTGYTAPLG